MASPAATTGCHHTCPAYDGDRPHSGGPVLQGSTNVFINGKAVCRVGDPIHCNSSSQDSPVQGSASIFVNGLPVARSGDPTAHGGVIVEGEQKILIG